MTNLRIGNAPCSWGTLEFQGNTSERIGYRQMLDELAETGYSGTELGDWGFMPTDPARLSEELRIRQLEMLGAFVGVDLRDPAAHGAGEAHALRVAKLLAAVSEKNRQQQQPFLVLADDNGKDPVRTRNAGRIAPEMGLEAEEWHVFCRGAERIAHAVADQTGLPTVFHHHCAGFVETPEETRTFLDNTDPDLLGLVFDTGHYLYGAGHTDSTTLLEDLESFRERIWYVHFKDCQPDIAHQARTEAWDYDTAVEKGLFCELGNGNIPFPKVIEKLEQLGYQGWVTVEQDVFPGMGSPKESAQRNRSYLRTLGC